MPTCLDSDDYTTSQNELPAVCSQHKYKSLFHLIFNKPWNILLSLFLTPYYAKHEIAGNFCNINDKKKRGMERRQCIFARQHTNLLAYNKN